MADKMGDMSSWKELILDEMSSHGENWTDLISITLSDDEAEEQFDHGYGGVNGRPFTAWTAARVYFPICCDGAERCGSAPRHPNGEALAHQGGDT